MTSNAMAFPKILSELGLHYLPTKSATAKEIEDPIDGYVEVTKVETETPEVEEGLDGLVVVIGGGSHVENVMATKEALTFCARRYNDRSLLKSSAYEAFLRECFITLLHCADGLGATNSASVNVSEHKYLLSNLKNLRPYFMKAFARVLTTLLDGVEAKNDDFEIAPVVWALRLGPLPLAAGFAEGKDVWEMLLEAEDKWVAEHVDKLDYEEKKASLQEFAKGVVEWVDWVGKMRQGCMAKKEDEE